MPDFPNPGPQGAPFPLPDNHPLAVLPPPAITALMNHFHLLPATGATAVSTHDVAIQPDLALVADVQSLAQRLRVVESEVAQLKRSHSEGGGAHDSADNNDATRPKRSKKSRTAGGAPDRILSGAKENMTTEQATVRAELQTLVRAQLSLLTGIQRNGITKPKDGEDSASDADSDVDLPASDDEDPATTKLLCFDFTQDVTAAANELVIQRAADIVWREQTDTAACTLTHKNILFTLKDLVAFGKDIYRDWRRKRNTANDPGLAKKTALKRALNRRAQRQKALHEDRVKVLAAYQKKHKNNVAAVLEEAAWMSDELSGLDTDDEGKRRTHRNELAAAARLSKEDKRWRSARLGSPPASLQNARGKSMSSASFLVNDIIDDLDALRREQRKANGKARRIATKRVNLGRLRQEPPAVPVYPFMLDTEWFKSYKAAHPGEEVFAKPEDPEEYNAEHSTSG
ncbi:hypothetical protein FA95DRAFT_1613306 [Auriscalpium vulgare]|uniref:Uncharacterized protein n=1 Tax=Auriscalpium vulgare TaxID=40419 RepID=A0ACB8R3R8_9AGAM|nr:hypothetical protein FA95DRAFT_1613306 [Auriscalpium vulgare]